MEQIRIKNDISTSFKLIDPTFTNVNKLLVLPFQRIAGQNNTTKDCRDSFSNY